VHGVVVKLVHRIQVLSQQLHVEPLTDLDDFRPLRYASGKELQLIDHDETSSYAATWPNSSIHAGALPDHARHPSVGGPRDQGMPGLSANSALMPSCSAIEPRF
jgi:hypothetical protein